MERLSVKNQDKEFVKYNNDFEQYAHVYSKQMAALFGDDDSKEDMKISRFIKILNHCCPLKTHNSSLKIL